MNQTMSPPPRTSRAESKEQTRLRLLESAQRVLQSRGYHGATLDRVAADAGLTKGAVYWHFPNKDALFLALLGNNLKRSQARLESLMAYAGDDAETLTAELGHWIDFIDERDAIPLLLLELEIASRGSPELAAQLQQTVSSHQARIGAVIDRYFEIVDAWPPMPGVELGTAIFLLAEGFALVRQTRGTQLLSSSQAVRVLLGMPPPSRDAPSIDRAKSRPWWVD